MNSTNKGNALGAMENLGSAARQGASKNTMLEGAVHVFGDNVDTDVIIPARYLATIDPKELAQHCMEDIDPDFVKKLNAGDIVVAGENFGCGSSREHAPLALKTAGVSCIIAKSFATYLLSQCDQYWTAILECPEAARELKSGDRIAIDLEEGTITRRSDGQTWHANPFPPFIRGIIEAGGLIEATKQKLSGKA